MKIKQYITLIIYLIAMPIFAQNYQDSLDIKLQGLADQNVLPGFAVAIIRAGEIKYSKGFGWADIQEEKAFTTTNIQNIASISKTFIGVALMKAVELGMLDLDDPIKKYLPYDIINPRFPDQAITICHLASHTGSLNDPEDYERAYIFRDKINIGSKTIPKGYKKYIALYNSNQRVSLDEFIKSVYLPGGKYYRKKNFLKEEPGKKYAYSNIGAGIASRIIEVAAGMTFVDFTQKYIFDPIGMSNTSWELDKVDLANKTTPYLAYNTGIPHYDLITFADGGIITSIEDLSKYIMEIMKCYAGNGTILSKASTSEMTTPYLKNSDQPYGIFWEVTKSGISIGHNGGDPGTLTNMYFQPENGVAKIMFVNMIPYEKKSNAVVGEVWGTIRKYQLLVN